MVQRAYMPQRTERSQWYPAPSNLSSDSILPPTIRSFPFSSKINFSPVNNNSHLKIYFWISKSQPYLGTESKDIHAANRASFFISQQQLASITFEILKIRQKRQQGVHSAAQQRNEPYYLRGQRGARWRDGREAVAKNRKSRPHCKIFHPQRARLGQRFLQSPTFVEKRSGRASPSTGTQQSRPWVVYPQKRP